ncbi:MAG TPA: helix-turn-helix transcriptional regulator [Xanthobacteraceae bacterium]|nr:helix-turn-helix transcriptional regulator [Xanthobacteraceae bacterium]
MTNSRALPACSAMAVATHLCGEPVLRRRQTIKTTLTAREIEVLRWVANGKSAWEIGKILNITKRTVDEHVQRAVRKLGAVNRTHAVAITLRNGIIKL